MIENSVVSCPPCHVAGGDWHYTRYSTLFQINVNNVKNLKGACVSHLGSLWPTVVPWSWLSPRRARPRHHGTRARYWMLTSDPTFWSHREPASSASVSQRDGAPAECAPRQFEA
jgi:hypothetical protein